MSRELDAAVAEHVMGWKWYRHPDKTLVGWIGLQEPGEYFGTGKRLIEFEPTAKDRARPSAYDDVPYYTSDTAADYAVLCKVRDDWSELQINAWHLKLAEIWHDRLYGERRGFVISSRVINYLPGDYSLAALAALGIECNSP